MNTLAFHHLEDIYDEIAQAIDQVGAENESVFLAKLVLSLAHEYGNADRISALIQDCLHEPSFADQKVKMI